MELKHCFRSGSDIRNRCSCHRRNQQRKQRGHSQVYHKHFQRKHQSCNRCLENTCNGTGSTTTHQKHQSTVLHFEDTSQIGTNSRACQYNRCLRSYRTTKTNGYGTGNHRRPCIVSLNPPLPTRNGIKDFCNSMTDVILHDIAHKQACQKNSHYRINQIKVVGLRCIEIIRQEILYPVYQHLQYQSCNSRKNTYQKTEYQDKLFFLYILFTPQKETLKQTSLLFFHIPIFTILNEIKNLLSYLFNKRENSSTSSEHK